MSRRYLLAIGDPDRLSAVARDIAAGDPGMAVERPAAGLLLASTGIEVACSRAGRSILIGRMFDRATGTPVGRLESIEVELHRTGGKAAIDRFWGGYFLFLNSGDEHHVALRDPSADVPVHHAEQGGLQLYFSDLAAAELAGPLEANPDPLFAALWLSSPYLRTARTGIEGVGELLGGTARRWSRSGGGVETLWSPWRFAAAGSQITSFGEASAMLKDGLLSTIPLAAGCGRRALLQLSGGLDSSIVGAALASGGGTFSALNYHTDAPDGDERRYARALAASLDIELHEHAGREAMAIELPPRTLRPGANPALVPLLSALRDQARKSGATQLLSGAGGDNLFCFLTTAAPVVDAWKMADAGAAWRSCHDLAVLTGATVWEAARAAVRKAARARCYWRRDSRFLCPSAIPAEPARHPWLDDAPAAALPGKHEHVKALVSIQHFLDRGVAGLPPQRHPLLNQPLIELCLRIPSWLWIHEGRDRAVARHAMASLVPAEILARRSKGRLESIFFRTYRALRPDLYALVEDGSLAQAGLIDGAAIKHYLDHGEEPGDDCYVRLLEIGALELWWRSLRQ